MRTAASSRSHKASRVKASRGRLRVGIRELKAKASAVVEDVKSRQVTYAVTKRGKIQAFIVPADAAEHFLGHSHAENAWEAWQEVLTQLTQEAGKKVRSAMDELENMRR